MTFTTYEFLVFFAIFFVLYWGIGERKKQNLLLLVASYIFYGWVHQWFLILIGISTVVDYYVGLALERHPRHKDRTILLSLLFNLGLLGTFKYFNFFAENFRLVFEALGFHVGEVALSVYLPIGISFYTFQSLTYTIDVYRGKMKACHNFLDFAVFVCFWPQLVSGPIERAVRFLPQIENPRKWRASCLDEGLPLILGGYLKKMVIADNVAVYVDKVFLLSSPSFTVLFAGAVAFSLQILADFSGYTDIARGTAKLLGFDLMLNFNRPYLAISPSDFWRRWHISFSTWIRDYVYIPLGGSRVKGKLHFFIVIMITMTLSGLWHGASWHFVLWGVYHGLILSVYHFLGFGGKWKPSGIATTLFSWGMMYLLTVFGWLLFRVPSMEWLIKAVSTMSWGFSDSSATVASVIMLSVAAYSVPLWILLFMDYKIPRTKVAYATYYAVAVLATVLLSRDMQQDFIYFQF